MAERKIRVGVNGFGRIGRLATRFLLDSEVCEVVHVNELNADVSVSAYLLEFDSIHGKCGKKIEVDDGCIVVDGKKITYSSCGTPGEVAWKDAQVDLVLECSGKFNDETKLQAYFSSDVKRVLVSAPVKGAVNVVVGCNENLVEPDTKIVTAASCTTNCIGPVIKCIDETFGIERGVINTVHNVTNTQSIMDAPNTKKDDPRRARAGMLNLAPTSTGSAKAITMIFPHLQGKLNGVAIRVPLQNASITDLTLELKRNVSKEEVNEALSAAADDHVLGFETRGLVSTDYINDTRSSIVDALSTMVVDDKLVKILAWYDNEMGYSSRMRDIAELMAKQMQ
ncbi:Glyceraldehyde-3-phosphate dehydrogenase [Hondaea fermentalgiana]|uniref:Glyceraldehyde-3-phosphate dehydrogenase n=1 Tax=Hondaea fermentalgiana TaxID=2315210 RepID=A0A2R5GGQ4_9STRA|nr:Glyceraldehyde-3-phosphate dehydrogenase [Hondaea fermentalgiana]|eukprot:GBG30057.1 Glyceraldehyde-3-phosphate dehydrogenase [Hondaea fermentalgiana]